MTPYSSTLAWKIPWVEEPGGLQSMGSHRVGHDWSDFAAAAAAAVLLTSLSMIISRSIQVAANGIISFFFWWLGNIPLYMFNHIFFIYSSVNEHLGCFHVLAIVNSAALNIGMHVSFWISFFSGYMPRVGLLDHMTVHGLTKSWTRLNNRTTTRGNSMENSVEAPSTPVWILDIWVLSPKMKLHLWLVLAVTMNQKEFYWILGQKLPPV